MIQPDPPAYATGGVPEDLAETAEWERLKRPDNRGEIVVRWNGPIVVEAPKRSRISLELIQAADPRALRVHGSAITLGDDADGRPVTYAVTGWDHGYLLVERTTP